MKSILAPRIIFGSGLILGVSATLLGPGILWLKHDQLEAIAGAGEAAAAAVLALRWFVGACFPGFALLIIALSVSGLNLCRRIRTMSDPTEEGNARHHMALPK
jgi:hypothetical protein